MFLLTAMEAKGKASYGPRTWFVVLSRSEEGFTSLSPLDSPYFTIFLHEKLEHTSENRKNEVLEGIQFGMR